MATSFPAPKPVPPERSTQEVAIVLLASWLFLAVGQRLLLLGKYPAPTMLGEGALELRGRFLFFAFANGLATDLVVFTVMVGPPLLALHLLRRARGAIYRALCVLPWIPIGVLTNVLFFNWVSFLRTDHALSFMLLALFMSSPEEILHFLAREAGGWHKLVGVLLGIGIVPACVGFLLRLGARAFPAIGCRLRVGIRARMVLILLLLQVGYVVRASIGSGIESLRGRWLYTLIREHEDPTWRLVTGAIWAFTSPTLARDLNRGEREALRPVLTPWDTASAPIDPMFPLYRALTFTGARQPDPLAPEEPVNVALVLLESTGVSDLGVFGDTAGLTPCFDNLASEGFLYTSHVTTAPDSVGAVVSLLSSSYPEPSGRDGAIAVRGSLPDVLTRAGYSSSLVVVQDTGWRRVSALARGMELLSMPQGKLVWGDDKEIFAKSLEWIDRTPSPWLATVFTASHHSPWVVPGESKWKANVPWDAARDTLKYQDEQLCSYVNELRRRDKETQRRTLLVIVGDHGTHFVPQTKHLNIAGLREDTLHVPLLLHAPGWIEPGTSDILSSHVDVMPTIVDLLGIEGAESAAMGQSLLRGGQKRAFTVSGVGAGYLGLLRSDRKLVLDMYKGETTISQAFSDEPVADASATDTLLKETLALNRLSSWLLFSRQLAPPLPDGDTRTPRTSGAVTK